MTRPYSLDLRERVVASKKNGLTSRQVADRFNISVSCVVKLCQRERATGSVAPGKVGGHRRYILETERDWLLARLEAKPDLTLHALLRELEEERGVKVCCDTLWRFLKREGKSFKKNAVRRRAGPA